MFLVGYLLVLLVDRVIAKMFGAGHAKEEGNRVDEEVRP